MRLYIKLFAIVLIAASIQHGVFLEGPPSELWFGLRCRLAYAIRDQRMIDRLLQEAPGVPCGIQYRVNASGG